MTGKSSVSHLHRRALRHPQGPALAEQTTFTPGHVRSFNPKLETRNSKPFYSFSRRIPTIP